MSYVATLANNINNLSESELVREAELTDNTLALRIYDTEYDRAVKEIESKYMLVDKPEDTDFPYMDGNDRYDVVKMAMNPDWIKMSYGYVLSAFDEDTNLYHNSVIVRHLNDNVYEVEIGYGPYGETGYRSGRINGLKAAKNMACRKVIELACNGEINC
jgi:hypothetical protein